MEVRVGVGVGVGEGQLPVNWNDWKDPLGQLLALIPISPVEHPLPVKVAVTGAEAKFAWLVASFTEY